ncbi:RNA polymerase sigma factor [Phytoactinopolyspora limicola]|uniref:RNA polymerase sigma factor n=1 Tax=Phytoactinopolyspora limicola TaxID=2715536 RepID=UPI00140A02E2|nr:sigma-70 family RNA polymerase sigma factor [Phytoactinopolyspora limicola]
MTHGAGVDNSRRAGTDVETGLAQIRAGDDDAVARAYQSIAPVACTTAHRIVRDTHTAEDLVQEAFYLVLRAIYAGHGPTDSFGGYLLSTVRRLAYEHSKRQSRITYSDEASTEELPDPVGVATWQSDLVGAAWASLPGRWRSVLWLIEVDRYSPTELAAALGLTPNAVSSLATRARQALRVAYFALARD